jgi:hypothetical protein
MYYTCTLFAFAEWVILRLEFQTLNSELSQKMGFRNTKPPSGCSAIIWNEKLLPQDTDINIHNPLQENELEKK